MLYFAIGIQIVILITIVYRGTDYVKRLFRNRKRAILSNTLLEKQPIEITRDLALGVIMQHVSIVPGIKDIHHNPVFFSNVIFTLAGMVMFCVLVRIYVVDKANSRLPDTILNYTIATIVMYVTFFVYFSIPVIYIIKQYFN